MSLMSWVSAVAAASSIALSLSIAALGFADGGNRLPLNLGEGVIVMVVPLSLSTLSAVFLPIGSRHRPRRITSALAVVTVLSWLTLFGIFGAAGFYNLF